MTTRAEPRRIELTVRRSEDSLRGCARDEAGQTHEFTGWLGLLGALEVLLADPPPVSTTEDT